MRMKIWLSTASLILAIAATSLAQEHKMENMSPEQKAQMDAMMKAMTPGDAHKLLEPLVGNFDAKITMWMDPTAPPTVTTGTATSKWVLGNREIEQRFVSTMMGMPFYGIGYTGYDNVKKQYWGTWMDNFSTSVMNQTGSTTDGKSWKYTGTMPDPATGKDAVTETRFTLNDADHHTMEMWSPGHDGKMQKMMEIVYTRKK